MSWSTAPDLKAQVMRLWERGELLREGLDAATSRFPLRLSLKTPSPDDITRRFDAVRAWVVAISATPHVRLEWQETRHRTRFAKFGEGALVLLVAIPLPMTGAWTGSLLAVLFGIPWRRALLMISLGVLLAGVIVLLASLGVIAVL